MTGRYCPFFFQSGISGADNAHDVRRFHQALQHLVLFTGSDENLEQEGFRQKLMEIQALFYEDCPFLCLYWRTGTVVSRYMYTTNRDVREYQLLRGIQGFFTK